MNQLTFVHHMQPAFNPFSLAANPSGDLDNTGGISASIFPSTYPSSRREVCCNRSCKHVIIVFIIKWFRDCRHECLTLFNRAVINQVMFLEQWLTRKMARFRSKPNTGPPLQSLSEAYKIYAICLHEIMRQVPVSTW